MFRIPTSLLLILGHISKCAGIIFAILASFEARRALHKYLPSRTNMGLTEASRTTALKERATVWSTTRFSASAANVLEEHELRNRFALRLFV
jgi:hypothetical protein